MHISTMLLKHVTLAGYFRPPPERPQANNIGFQRPAPNNLPAGAPISGHGVSQMFPCRPDISALNGWRPA
jgi:hypothetical protein